MHRPENWLLGAAFVVFVVFLANVTLGTMGFAVFMSDPVEMMTLLMACILFVAATVRCEIRESHGNRRQHAAKGGDRHAIHRNGK